MTNSILIADDSAVIRRSLRSKKDSPRVPIVMLTMFKDKFLEDRAYKAGVSLVLSKEESMGRVADYARILLKPDAPKESTRKN